jgi:hypothetical protein
LAKVFLLIRKAEAPCTGKKEVHFFLGATGIRQAGEKVVLYLFDGLAYDRGKSGFSFSPEPLGAAARQSHGLTQLISSYFSTI